MDRPLDARRTRAVVMPPRPRICRRVLAEPEDATSLADLAAHLVGADPPDGRSGTDPTLEDVMLRLHHVDLPTLAEHGLVDYDPDRRLIEAGEHAALVEAALEVENLTEAATTQPTE